MAADEPRRFRVKRSEKGTEPSSNRVPRPKVNRWTCSQVLTNEIRDSFTAEPARIRLPAWLKFVPFPYGAREEREPVEVLYKVLLLYSIFSIVKGSPPLYMFTMPSKDTFTDPITSCGRADIPYSVRRTEVCPGVSVAAAWGGFVSPHKPFWLLKARTAMKLTYTACVIVGTGRCELPGRAPCGNFDLSITTEPKKYIHTGLMESVILRAEVSSSCYRGTTPLHSGFTLTLYGSPILRGLTIPRVDP
ncbi:hypothetical protein Bbelb_181360 [Branchiostoma belcheri]|nr:hypothetical protein Bbelb_181360 [Branchiostoma belcheri]